MTTERKPPGMKGPKGKFVCFLVLWLFGSVSFARSQDVVVASTAADPSARIKKSGTILEFTGTELKLRSALATEETIPTARVIDFQTRWTPAHEAGRAARTEGRLDDAMDSLRQAKREEPRTWAVRQNMADLTGVYLESGRIDNAGDEFLGILASDPATRHFDVVPIAWRGVALSPAIERRAEVFMATRNPPAAALLGASWLLASRRSEAIAVLEDISRSTDPRLSGLATIQLWRAKIVNATSDDTRRWQAQLEKMPADIQAAGWYVLGDVLSRQEQPEAAALSYLKVPILFRQQRLMAADALLAAGAQLEKMSQSRQAAELYRELGRDFPHLAIAKEAARRLEQLRL